MLSKNFISPYMSPDGNTIVVRNEKALRTNILTIHGTSCGLKIASSYKTCPIKFKYRGAKTVSH
jgi:hypothetical protein